MSNKTSSIFQALNESREEMLPKKKKVESTEPIVAPEEDNVCTCGEEIPGGAKFCPNCGTKVGALGNVSEAEDEEFEPEEDEEEEIVLDGADEDLEDEEGEEEEDEEDDEEEEEDEDVIEISKYNTDTVKALESILKSAKAPSPIMKAYEAKMYERCTFWLESRKGITIDLSEGFTKNEALKVRKYLTSIKAPRAIREAFEKGQHSLVAAYLKTRK